MNTRDIEELGWGERELRDLFTAFVRSHRRMPSRRELETFRSARYWGVAARGQTGLSLS